MAFAQFLVLTVSLVFSIQLSVGQTCSTEQCKLDCEYERCKCLGIAAAHCFSGLYQTDMMTTATGEECQPALDQCEMCCLFEQCQCFVTQLGEYESVTDCAAEFPPEAADCSATATVPESVMPIPALSALFVQYKGQLLLLLLASNLALLAYVCGTYKNKQQRQYAKVYLSDAQTGEDEKELL